MSRYEIYSVDELTDEALREEFAGQFIIYDAKHLQDIVDENGVIGFDSEDDAQDYIDNYLRDERSVRPKEER